MANPPPPPRPPAPNPTTPTTTSRSRAAPKPRTRPLPCTAAGCRAAAQPGRRICKRCRNARDKAADPARWSYHRHKAHARERGIAYALSLADFRQFAEATDYLLKVGRTTAGFHIDRRDATQGYTPDNIRLLPAPENSRKGATLDKAAHRLTGTLRHEWNPETRKYEFWMIHHRPAPPPPDSPF